VSLFERNTKGVVFITSEKLALESATLSPVEVPAGTGTVCALRVSTSTDPLNATEAQPPRPQCKLGGAAPRLQNGCPTDAGVTPLSKAWPICLAKASRHGEANPYLSGDFHCLLVCPCSGHGDDCGVLAHAHCPLGAHCERGELRNRAQGVCTYRQRAA